jgi:hypothetical protein
VNVNILVSSRSLVKCFTSWIFYKYFTHFPFFLFFLSTVLWDVIWIKCGNAQTGEFFFKFTCTTTTTTTMIFSCHTVGRLYVENVQLFNLCAEWKLRGCCWKSQEGGIANSDNMKVYERVKIEKRKRHYVIFSFVWELN